MTHLNKLIVFPHNWEDTRVVAVYVAVVQNEWDALQVSYLRKAENKSERFTAVKMVYCRLWATFMLNNFLMLWIRTEG